MNNNKEIVSITPSEQEYKRYYDKLRARVKNKLGKVEKKLGKNGVEIILLAPDLFVLVYRLMKDQRVETRHKIILGAVLAYWILPVDILPEVLLGSIGYLDDILITLYVLDALFADTDIDILLENWSGNPEVVKNIHIYSQKVKNLLNMIGGNIEQKALHFAELILSSGKKSED